MKLTIRCNPEYLLMVSKFVTKEEHRYYLRGVNIEKHPSKKGVILTATDGHRLASMYDENGSITGAKSAIIAVSAEMATALKKKKAKEFCQRGNISHVLQVGNIGDAADEINDCHIFTAHNKPIDGTFPDWRHVVPKEFKPIKRISFNHKYVESFTKLLNDGHRGVTAFFAGETSPTVFRLDRYPEEFLGVLMPLRSGIVGASPTPAWFE